MLTLVRILVVIATTAAFTGMRWFAPDWLSTQLLTTLGTAPMLVLGFAVYVFQRLESMPCSHLNTRELERLVDRKAEVRQRVYRVMTGCAVATVVLGISIAVDLRERGFVWSAAAGLATGYLAQAAILFLSWNEQLAAFRAEAERVSESNKRRDAALKSFQG